MSIIEHIVITGFIVINIVKISQFVYIIAGTATI